MAIFPILSPAELLPTLQAVQTHHSRQQPPPRLPLAHRKNAIIVSRSLDMDMDMDMNMNMNHHYRVHPHELVPHLVNGPRLGETSAHKLSDLASSLGELCSMVRSRAGVDRLVEYLGEDDARRVMEYLTEERAI